MKKFRSVLFVITFIFAATLFVVVFPKTAEAAELASTHAYYDVLDADEKAVYTQLVGEIKSINKNTITLVKPLKEVHSKHDPELENQGIIDVMDAIYHDHPELYWFGTINDGPVGYTESSNGKHCDKDGKKVDGPDDPNYAYTIITAVKLCYNEYADNKSACDLELETLFKKATEGVSTKVSTNATTNAKKVMAIHNNLAKLVYYDYEGRDHKKGEESYPIVDNTVYGTLKNGKAVCAGYARTFQYILHRLGIECYCVVGNAYYYDQDSDSMKLQESHEWNVVKIGTKYLNVDATWGDRYRESSRNAKTEQASYISFSYFAVADKDVCVRHRDAKTGTTTVKKEEFSESHIRSARFSEAVPKATSGLTKAQFSSYFGKSRTDAFVENFDEKYVAVVTSIDEYFEQVKEAFANGSYYNTTEGKVKYDPKTGGMYVSTTETESTRSLLSETRYVLIIGSGSDGEGLDLDIASTVKDQSEGSRMMSEWRSIKTDMGLKGTYVDTIEIDEEKYEISTCLYQSVNEGLLWTDIDCAYWTISQAITYIDKDLMPASIKANMRGDVNGDKIVDSKDAVQLLMSINFPDTYSITQPANLSEKDMNGDGKVNVDDAIRLLLNTKFPTNTNYMLNYDNTIKTE